MFLFTDSSPATTTKYWNSTLENVIEDIKKLNETELYDLAKKLNSGNNNTIWEVRDEIVFKDNRKKIHGELIVVIPVSVATSIFVFLLGIFIFQKYRSENKEKNQDPIEWWKYS